MNTLILLGLSALLAAEPAEQYGSSTSGSRQPLDIVLEQNAIGVEWGLDGNLLRLRPSGKWDPHPNRMAEGAYRWEGDPADYVQAIRRVPSHYRIALTLVGKASVKEPTDWLHSVALLKYLRGATNVVEINLSGQLSDADLAEVRDLPGLEVLNVEEFPEPHPRPIDAKPWQSITDEGPAVLKDLSGLRELRLKGTSITGTGLAGLTQLTTLTLRTDELTDAGVKALGELAGLEQLDLTGNVSDAMLAHLAGLTQLRRLTLRSPSFTGAGLRHLAGLENLHELSLGSDRLTNSGLESLAALSRLERLVLGGTWSGESLDEAMIPVGRVTSLRELILPAEIGDAGLAHLESLQNLRLIKGYSRRVSDAGLKSVGKLAALEDFSLSGAPLTDEGLANLQTLHNLRRLVLGGNEGIKGPGLKYLPAIGRLESLHLPVVTSESLAYLKRLPNLRELWVQVPDDNGLAHIADCASLEFLDCSTGLASDTGVRQLSRLTRLRYLHLIANRATDDGLVWLGELSNLETLWLHARGGGDATVMAIARLAKLEDLNLVGVAMTDSAVRRLGSLKNLRRLRIAYFGEDSVSEYPSDAALASLWDDLPQLEIQGPRGFAAKKGEPLDRMPLW